MDEAKWLGTAQTWGMLVYLRRQRRVTRFKAGRRKLRLFAVACCRRIESLLPGDRSRAALVVAERFAEERATHEERRQAMMDVYAERLTPPDGQIGPRRAAWAVRCSLLSEAYQAARDTSNIAYQAVGHMPGFLVRSPEALQTVEAERLAHSNLVREIFGNPFHPIHVPMAWLKWNDGTLVRLARSIDEERAYEQLPVVADALEEAGCTDATLLDHGRSRGPHVPGCWLLDLLTGKGLPQ